MWLCDLEKAVILLHKICPNYLFISIKPASAGILFYTTHRSRVFVSHEGVVIERDEKNNINFLTETLDKYKKV